MRVVLSGLFCVFAVPVREIFLLALLFHTPFAARPLHERIPGVSERYCPAGTWLAVERYSRNIHGGAKNHHRVICLDAAGRNVAEVSTRANLEAAAVEAVILLAILWPLIYLWVGKTFNKKRAQT